MYKTGDQGECCHHIHVHFFAGLWHGLRSSSLPLVHVVRWVDGIEDFAARASEEEHRALENLILEDLDELGQESADFRFFFVFAHEVLDGHARLLSYVNRFQPNENDPAPRPQGYNVRLLGAGRVTPYFIWPNVDPFRRSGSLVEAVPEPGSAAALVSGGENALSEARDFVRSAREGG